MRTTAIAFCVLALFASAQAQSPSIKRTLLQRIDVPGSNREAVTAIAEVAAGASAGRHTHPGVETSYVMEGSATLLIDGQPPRLLKAGDSFTIPNEKVHDAKVEGNTPLKVLTTYVVEKGKPLATPAK